jgi:hypothetical protein
VAKGNRLAIVIGLTPAVLVLAVLILFLGGTGGILFLVAVVFVGAIVIFAVQRQKSLSRRLYADDPQDWMSRSIFYAGPFDQTGLEGATHFERINSRYNNPPQVRLLVTNNGFRFGPAGRSGTPMSIPFRDLESVDLIEGIRPRTLVVTPPIADRVGQVVLRTTEGRLARFLGVPVQGVLAALMQRGALPNPSRDSS